MSSKLLWRQMQEGSQEAFTALFKRYYSELKAYGVKFLGSEELAQEGIQLLFLKIWERKHQFGVVHNPKAYLLRAYRTTLLDLLAKEKKRNTQRTEFFRSFTPSDFLSFLEPTLENSPPVYQFVNQLSEKQREIIFLKFYNQLSYQEIAEVLSINYQTVRNYMGKAIKILRKKMKDPEKK